MGIGETIPILNIGQFEQRLSATDFYSNNFEEHSKRNGSKIFRPHSHDFFLCVLFTQGTGVHEIDFDTFPIAPGSVFFLKPGQTHHWEFSHSPNGYIFFHTQDFYEMCFLNSGLSQFPFYFTHENPPALQLGRQDIGRFEAIFREINQEYLGNALYKYEKLNSLVNQLYIDLARLYVNLDRGQSVVSKSYLKILEKFQNVLEESFRSEKSPSFYAGQLHITTKHLNRITKNTLGKTCSTVIRERVVLEAKRLLVHSNSPLSNVAAHLGFQEYPYFSKIFKNSTGSTPYEFRKRY